MEYIEYSTNTIHETLLIEIEYWIGGFVIIEKERKWEYELVLRGMIIYVYEYSNEQLERFVRFLLLLSFSIHSIICTALVNLLLYSSVPSNRALIIRAEVKYHRIEIFLFFWGQGGGGGGEEGEEVGKVAGNCSLRERFSSRNLLFMALIFFPLVLFFHIDKTLPLNS